MIDNENEKLNAEKPAEELETAPKVPVAEQAEEKQEESIADRVRIISSIRLTMKRFFRSKLSVTGLALFLFLFIFSYFGPLFVPWGELEVDRTGGTPRETITAVYVKDANGKDLLDENGEKIVDYYTLKIFYPQTNAHATAGTYSHDQNPRLHLFGTDENGRDIFTRLMYGGRLSLTLSFLVVIVSSLIGVILGGLAGYFGKWVDMIIMRIVDILNCIPSLPILLILGALLTALEVDPGMRIYYMMGFLTLLSWTGIARLVRGQILTLREQEYIVAAEALGMGPMRKIFRHLVPNVFPQLIVSMTLGLGSTILTEASLSFLGIGVAVGMASWGQMVSSATKNLDILSLYVADWLPAGILIILAVLAFNFVGDGLRDALDPKMKR